MAMVAAAIANRGVLMKPYLVSEVRAPDLTLLSRTEPEAQSTAVSPQVAAALTDLLVDVVDNGTGSNARIAGVEVAGKTGTAQNGDAPPHAWFVSFAPARDASVAVAVIIEDGGGCPRSAATSWPPRSPAVMTAGAGAVNRDGTG